MKITKFGVSNPTNDTSTGTSVGGDLGGTLPAPTVTALQGTPVSSTAPVAGQILYYDGTSWIPATVHVIGTSADRPAADSANKGWLYYDADTGDLWVSTGTAWQLVVSGNASVLVMGPDLAQGATTTAYSSTGTNDPGTPANLTDGNDATASGLSAGFYATPIYEGWRLDFGTPVTLDNFSLLATQALTGFSGAVGWRVRTSDDGTSWTTLHEATEAGWVDVSGGAATTFRLVRGHPRATSRYWEFALKFSGTTQGYMNTLLWRRMPAGSHKLFSDEHADVDLTTAPTDGQVLVWSTTAGKFAPGAMTGFGDIDGGTPTSVYGGVGVLIDCGGV